MDNHKRDAWHLKYQTNASRTLVWLFVLVGLITAVTACNTSPTPESPSPTTPALLPPAPTPLPTQTATTIPSPEPSPTPLVPTAIETLSASPPAVKTTPLPVATSIDQQNAYPYPEPVEAAASPTATIAPTNTPTPIPTIDFAAVKAELQANGQDIGYTKIGFHVAVGGNMEGLEDWMRELDAAGVPFFLKSVDNAEPIYIAQEMMKESGVPHTLVFRKAAGGTKVNLPNYDLPPAVAAQEHWQLHRDGFPPELDPNYVWLETVNEVDKNRSEWLAQFAIETAKLTMQDGYKWSAFGWSSGEPEPEQWQAPYMLEFLRLAGENPDKLAIAVHEYSYLLDTISHIYPYKVGRFQELFRIADANGIPRPTVLITEWGWTYQHVPEPAIAIDHIDWASALYAPYPEVKGAAIWYLGEGDTFGNIADEAQQLIDPLRIYALTHYFTIPLPPEQQPINPEQHQPAD